MALRPFRQPGDDVALGVDGDLDAKIEALA
jgi:hypothetical protein